MMRKWLDNPLVIVILIILLGLGIRQVLFKPQVAAPSQVYGSETAEPLFAANFVDVAGKMQALNQYKGKILVVNFWASWCGPCREEMPELSHMHTQYLDNNVMVLGIALDNMEDVKAFLESAPVSYPIFIADDAGMPLAQQMGNDQGVLPYTVIVRPDGSIANVYFGRINQQALEQTLLPIVQANAPPPPPKS